MKEILRIEGVSKVFRDTRAVDNVSFNVPAGRIFGLLGPNGAGKTTLIRMITSILDLDSGVILLDGERLRNAHVRDIGYLPEERGLYKKMKVGDHLLYLARLKGLSRKKSQEEISAWLEKFDISGWWSKKVDELSKGMQQKIQFISTVVHRPKLLIFDEPFSGLDPINTNLIKEEIRRFRDEGVSILFSTHRMEQVEELCQDIVLINQGRNVLEGSVRQLREDFKLNHYEVQFTGEMPASLTSNFELIHRNDEGVVVQLSPEQSSNDLLKIFIDNGNQIFTFREIYPSLNEIFIRQVQSRA